MREILITNSDDMIDVRDVIARYEQLESSVVPADESDGTDNDERLELATLRALLDELKGNGGDEQWQGDWYPVTLIRDTYFRDYAQELAEDIGAVPKDLSWPACHIDWEAATDALQTDYSQVEFDGVTYWYR